MADCKKYNGGTWEHSLRKLGTATDTIATLPVDVYADGNSATVGLKGNTVQNGTPTPDNPIMPQGTGDMSENLFYKKIGGANIDAQGKIITNSDFDMVVAKVTEGETYSVSGCSGIMGFYVSEPEFGSRSYNNQRNNIVTPVTIPQGVNYVAYRVSVRPNVAMLNSGSTALPYEPYGQYKIPISSAGQTSNIYLGEVQTTRKIKKLVLDGTENWFLSTAQAGRFGLPLSDYLKSNGTITSFCSHYMAIVQKSGGTVPNNSQYFYSGSDAARYLFIVDTNCSTAADFKSYLGAQYAAGTPVTVWYILTEPETAVVNEPLMKIGEYADAVSGITIPTITGKDTFDVETTLKPSEASLSYTGWHDATVEEWDGSQWNQ